MLLRAFDPVGLVLSFVFTVWFCAVAFATSPAVIDGGDGLVLALLYALLSLVLGHAIAVAARIHRALAIPAGLATAALLLWHLREQSRVHLEAPEFALATVVLGLVIGMTGWMAGERYRRGEPLPAAIAVVAFVALLCAGIASAYHGSNVLRWRLLRHNKLLGTPAYYALADPLSQVCEEVWDDTEDPDAAVPGTDHSLAKHSPRPHLVFVLLDTLRADSLRAFRTQGELDHSPRPLHQRVDGSPLMPLLDEWADEAVALLDVRGNSTWTRPSIASMLTGVAPEEHGATDRAYRLPEHFDTLPESLARAGYHTAAFVSNWAAVGRDAGFDQGYEHFAELEVDPYARAEQVNEAVRRWLDRADPRQTEDPFFLYLHYLDPHTPYLAGEGSGLTYPEVEAGSYAREAAYLDSHVTGLMRELEARLPGDVVFVVIADHGEEFGEHSETGHGHALYPETGRVPVLVRAPKLVPGTLDFPLEARHLHPLLLDLLDNPEVDLEDRVKRLSGPVRRASIESTTPTSLHRPYRGRVCMRSAERDGHVVIWSGYGRTVELYDLETDPQQTHNLANAKPELRDELLALLEDPSWTRARREPVLHRDDTLELLCELGYAECDEDSEH